MPNTHLADQCSLYILMQLLICSTGTVVQGEVNSGDLVVWDAHYSDRLGFVKDQLATEDQWKELVSFQNDLVTVIEKR